MPLISIVVPVYKVEEYLPRCIDSLLSQTYRNIEIILVDDGSPDKCGIICDEYAKKDIRIKVVHKPNCGLSSARNAGIAIANGEYISFVDSDDWVDKDFISKMIAVALSEKADLVSCGTIYDFPNNTISKTYDNNMYVGKDIMLQFLKNSFGGTIVCGKLFRIGFISGIPFCEGRDYEDILVAHKFIKNMNKVVVISDCLYHYWMRNTSISHDHSFKNISDYWNAMYTRYNDLINDSEYSYNNELINCLLKGCASAASRTWRYSYKFIKTNRDEINKLTKNISEFVRSHYKVFGVKDYSKTINLMLFLARYNSWLSMFIAYYLNRFGRKIIGKSI